ncbi:hypothetical protein LZ32DRAFT_108804 [Colletotrichum eremochloae]|nr:hypothetical protein LZ32DRAFT_108804 [Colletotrichum eremochloae]
MATTLYLILPQCGACSGVRLAASSGWFRSWRRLHVKRCCRSGREWDLTRVRGDRETMSAMILWKCGHHVCWRVIDFTSLGWLGGRQLLVFVSVVLTGQEDDWECQHQSCH